MYDFSHMIDRDEIEIRLADYEAQHKGLDDAIDRIMRSGGAINMFEIAELKKKKLWLKDVIQRLKSSLIDDIIA